MKIYQYQSHADYIASQVEANVRKIRNIWVEMKTIAEIVQRHGTAGSVLCHGTRNAAEQKFFQEFYPQAEIIGTEISHTAERFPMTVQWDFHEVHADWCGHFDIVYSNSFDHTYDPVKALSVWKDQLSQHGKMYLEHGYGETENISKASDPLEIYEQELMDLFAQAGLGLLDTFESTGVKGVCPCRIYILQP